MPDTEIWKPVKGFEGLYEVSSLGRVFSIRREKFLKGRIICGTQTIAITLSNHGIRCDKTLGQLVAETFIGPPPCKNVKVKHIDGNPYNNVVSNLKWDVRRAFYLPENPEARKLFNEYAENNVLTFIHMRHKYLNTTIVDTDDFKQEALLEIWRDIDSYDGQIKFSTFCYTKCHDVFYKFCRKYCKIKSREISAYEICRDGKKPKYLLDTLACQDNFYERIDENA